MSMQEVLLCGGTAGFLSNIICHPLDTIKSIFQFNLIARRNVIKKEIANMVRTQGIRSLYKGYSIVLISTVPSTGIYFMAYENSKKIIKGPNESPLKQFCCGIYAQFLSNVIFTPRDVIKERLQIQNFQQGEMKNKYTGAINALRVILKEEGLSALYRGYWQTLILWGFYGGIYLSIFTKLKEKMAAYTKRDPNNLAPYLILPCALSAASISAVVTNPLDVLKLHFQVQRSSKSLKGLFVNGSFKFGLSSMFRGALERLYWVAPRTGISFTTYEFMSSNYFQGDKQHQKKS
jgi:hypothetical protein